MNIFDIKRPVCADDAIELHNIARGLVEQARLAYRTLLLAPDKIWDEIFEYDTIELEYLEIQREGKR